MKLIDFTQNDELTRQREKMNAPFIIWDGFSKWNDFDPLEFRAALNQNGEVAIPFSEITINSDSTLELFNKKILVYIRDQRGGYYSNNEYRFHISNCSTLKDAINNNRYDRYVASTSLTSTFNINVRNQNNEYIERDKEVVMKVCKNCLSNLNYKNYNQDFRKRNEIFQNFKLEEYFGQYNKQSIIQPKYSSATAPLNNYTSDFTEISKKLKASKNYCCQECSIDLSKYKWFLHVHHIDGMKQNNRENNLKVLCISCHSDQPAHEHMKNTSDYLKFIELKGSIENKI